MSSASALIQGLLSGGYVLETVWNSLHRAYFNGYAIWTYLTTPFFLVIPGFEVTEISP